MLEFVWCLVVTTWIGIGFKLFTRFQVNTFNAIVINYTICLLLGTLLNAEKVLPFSPSILAAPWFLFDVLLGFLFIAGFNLTAFSIQRAGITLTTLTQRMSLILTVSFTVILFHEPFGWIQAIGLILALMAIVAINQKGGQGSFSIAGRPPLLLLTVLVFSAAIEILLFYVEKSGIVGQQQMAFTTHGFGCAAVIGWIATGWLCLRKGNRITFRDIIAGVMLGIPNFFSIYLLLRMLNQGWDGSVMYPLVNVSVLLLSTFVAVIAFREKMSRINWIGIALASAAILMIAYAHNPEMWKTGF